MARWLLAVVFLALLAGCATVDAAQQDPLGSPRKIYGGQIYGHCR